MNIAPEVVNESYRTDGPVKTVDAVKRWFWVQFTTGLPEDYDIETLRKIFLINLIVFLGAFFLVGLGVIEFLIRDYVLCGINAALFLFLIFLLIYLRKTRNYHPLLLIGTATAGLFFLFLIAYGGMGNTAYVWAFTYPLITIFLLGTRKGSLFSLTFLMAVCVVFVFGPAVGFIAVYNTYLKIRFVPAYLTVYLLAFAMEKTREMVLGRLLAAQLEMQKALEKLETANAALAERDAQYRQIFESIQDVYYRTKLNGEIVIISPSIREVGGYDPEEMIGRSVLEIYADPAERDRLILEMMKSGRVHNYELTLKSKDGRLAVSSVTGRVICDEEGRPQGFAGVMRDITDRKHALEALQKSEERYRLLADNIMDTLWTFDLATMRYTYFSPSIMGVLGYTVEEAMNLQFKDVLTPSCLDMVMQVLAEELERAMGHYDPSRSRTLELEQVRKDGSIVWTEVSVRFIHDKERKPVALLGVTRNITERKRLQQQLQKSQKMEFLGLLAGGVAHDLNNVLSGIVSYPELLLLNLPEDSQLRKPLQTMRESGLRAAAIVQDLLTIARGVARANEPLNLNQLVTDYLHSPECRMLRQYHPDVHIQTCLEDDLLNISGSAVHIRKVVMNLVSNAAESIQGRGDIVISTSNRYLDTDLKGLTPIGKGEYAVLSVSDTGAGISADDLERIFEPFYTKKKMGRSGTGLGLSVVWNVMQDHNGYIDVSSSRQGTSFDLYFPVTRDAVVKSDADVSIKEYMGNGETILVVDDVASQREISCRMLEALGYQSVSVPSGEAAVEYLKDHAVDLVLLDMIMDPGINGRETYERIKKHHPGQKAIIVSGFSETADVRRTQAMGAGKYVKKPLTIENIGLAVKEELHQ